MVSWTDRQPIRAEKRDPVSDVSVWNGDSPVLELLLEIGSKGRQTRPNLTCKPKAKLRDLGWQSQTSEVTKKEGKGNKKMT